MFSKTGFVFLTWSSNLTSSIFNTFKKSVSLEAKYFSKLKKFFLFKRWCFSFEKAQIRIMFANCSSFKLCSIYRIFPKVWTCPYLSDKYIFNLNFQFSSTCSHLRKLPYMKVGNETFSQENTGLLTFSEAFTLIYMVIQRGWVLISRF